MRPTRRRFIRDTATLGAGAAIARKAAAASAFASAFASAWTSTPDRVWIGPEYWANPLQDWRVAGGRLVCTSVAPECNVHLLTRQLAGDFTSSVTVARVAKGSAGFRVAANGPLREYRDDAIYGAGADAGFADGKLFAGDATAPLAATARDAIELRVDVAGRTPTLSAHEPGSGRELGRVARDVAPPVRAWRRTRATRSARPVLALHVARRRADDDRADAADRRARAADGGAAGAQGPWLDHAGRSADPPRGAHRHVPRPGLERRRRHALPPALERRRVAPATSPAWRASTRISSPSSAISSRSRARTPRDRARATSSITSATTWRCWRSRTAR